MKRNFLMIIVFIVLIALFAFAASDWKLPWAGEPVHGSDWCEAHKVTLSKCEICNPKQARGGTYTIREREPKEGECPLTLIRIHLAPGAAESVGLALATVEMKQIAETLRANAETLYPPSRYARVAPRIPGVVREVKVILGQEVTSGTMLAVLESADFGQAKTEYLQAIAVLHLRQKTYDQEKDLSDKKITAGRDLLRAATELEEAKQAVKRTAQKLSAFGMSADDLKQLSEKQETSSLLEVKAPFAGKVVEAAAVPGEIATPEKPIFAVADMERLWIAMDVTEADLAKIEKDQRVTFAVEGIPGKKFSGKVVASGGEVDDRTRTVRVFADIKNADGLLRAKMFGRAEITVKPPEPKLLVPKEAVHNDGDHPMIFVSPSKDVFRARKVETGAIYANSTEVTSGLVAGEKVVTTGSFLLKTELMRGQMGAG